MSIKSFLHELKKQMFCSPRFDYNVDYDNYWQDRRGNLLGKLNSYQKDRLAWLVDRVDQNDSVLDLGCGDGAILIGLKKLGFKNISGMDSSDVAINFLNSQDIRATKLVLDPDKKAALPVFDHIILFEVLEHLPNSENVLIDTLEKANKSVFVSVPNTGYFPYRIRLLMGRFPVQWRLSPGEHVRFWTYKDFHFWLKCLDLDCDLEIRAYQGLPFFNKIFPNLFAAGIICRIRRSNDYL